MKEYKRLRTYNVPAFLRVLESLNEPRQAADICKVTGMPPSTILYATKVLWKAKNIDASVGENHHNQPVIIYNRTEKGLELLRALDVVEKSLKQ